MTLSFTCAKCPGRRDGILLAALIGGLMLSICWVGFLHLTSREQDANKQSVAHRVTRFLPVQSVRIVIVVWQVITQVSLCSICAHENAMNELMLPLSILMLDRQTARWFLQGARVVVLINIPVSPRAVCRLTTCHICGLQCLCSSRQWQTLHIQTCISTSWTV